VSLPERRLVLNRINAIWRSIDITQRIRLVHRLRDVAGATMRKSHALVTESVVYHLLIVITSEMVQMLSL
jgi:hypothetical protein